jgi:hypothetical protein
VPGVDIVGVIVDDALLAGDMPDGAQRRAANLASPFRDRIGHSE